MPSTKKVQQVSLEWDTLEWNWGWRWGGGGGGGYLFPCSPEIVQPFSLFPQNQNLINFLCSAFSLFQNLINFLCSLFPKIAIAFKLHHTKINRENSASTTYFV